MNICPYCGKEKKLVSLATPRYMAKGSSRAMHGLSICAKCKTILDKNGSIKSLSGDFMAFSPILKEINEEINIFKKSQFHELE